MKCLAFAFLLLVSVAAAAEPDPSRTARAQEAFDFAESLFHDGDFYRAITEYKRAAFLAGDAPLASRARLGIGLSYQAGEKWEPALETFRALVDAPSEAAVAERAAFELAETLRKAEDLTAAEAAYARFLTRFPDSKDADRARLARAVCLSRLGRREEAAKVLDQVPPASPLAPEAGKARAALGAMGPKPKSPALAGVLSAVLPGAGQCYAGYPMGGAATFLMNAGLIGATVESFRTDRNVLGVFLGTGALLTYVGNIYGAVGDAHKANHDAEDERLRDTEAALGKTASAGLLPGGEASGRGERFALVWTRRF